MRQPELQRVASFLWSRLRLGRLRKEQSNRRAPTGFAYDSELRCGIVFKAKSAERIEESDMLCLLLV